MTPDKTGELHVSAKEIDRHADVHEGQCGQERHRHSLVAAQGNCWTLRGSAHRTESVAVLGLW